MIDSGENGDLGVKGHNGSKNEISLKAGGGETRSISFTLVNKDATNK